MTIPDYTLRYSQKAKYLQLRISARGLEVIVPAKRRASPTMIEQFVQQKKPWILRHWQRWLQTQEQREILPLQLPDRVTLPAIEQTWEVLYFSTATEKLKCVINQSRQIKFLGNLSLKAQCVKFLRQWLKKIAEQYLGEQLRLLAKQYGFSFGQVRIKHTITRWGSCSNKRNINLCCYLLFLPAPLVKHVLLHELCHTKVMTHGVRFWQLLGKLDEECDKHRKELKDAGQYVPKWAV